eukprot:scaffold191922_cov31-Tisochrysis_lutea.AAC.2
MSSIARDNRIRSSEAKTTWIAPRLASGGLTLKVNPLRHASVEADRCRPFTLLGGDGWLGIVECGNDLWGRLHKLQKYALSRVGKGLISCNMT